MKNTVTDEQTVFIVDDDSAVRHSLGLLLRSMSLPAEAFESAQAFLDSDAGHRPGCLIADIRMPGMSGLELQQEMAARDMFLPIIFITGHGTVSMAVQAIRAGAVDFLEKPFDDQDLLDRVNQALLRDREQRADALAVTAIRERMQLLTPRELEVMHRIVKGDANKVIAADLNLSERTIELHRARVMHKMAAGSLAELVAAVTRLDSRSR